MQVITLFLRVRFRCYRNVQFLPLYFPSVDRRTIVVRALLVVGLIARRRRPGVRRQSRVVYSCPSARLTSSVSTTPLRHAADAAANQPRSVAEVCRTRGFRSAVVSHRGVGTFRKVGLGRLRSACESGKLGGVTKRAGEADRAG